MNVLNKIILIAMALLMCIVSSCKSDNDEPTPEKAKQSLLIYMVAANTLNESKDTDLEEILVGAKYVDFSKFNVLIFEHGKYESPVLWKLEKDNGVVSKTLVKAYLEDPSSASKARISSVIADMLEYAPAENYGLVLWSHALGWTPAAAPQKLKLDNGSVAPTWFGDDYGVHINIDELAEAIPDNLFSFIWMDCCYMSGIETIYELRNKCQTYIGYPTEILADGMPYNLTLPYIMREQPDLVGAATATFDYYSNQEKESYRSCTIAVVDMTKIEDVAEAAKIVLKDVSTKDFPVDTYNLQRYSRGSQGPYFDFIAYMGKFGDEYSSPIVDLRQVFNDMVIYKAATEKFLTINIDYESFSGVSVHALRLDGSEEENYYKTLDWYQRVYPTQKLN